MSRELADVTARGERWDLHSFRWLFLVLSPPRFVGERVRERGQAGRSAAADRPMVSGSLAPSGPSLPPPPNPLPSKRGERGQESRRSRDVPTPMLGANVNNLSIA